MWYCDQGLTACCGIDAPSDEDNWKKRHANVLAQRNKGVMRRQPLIAELETIERNRVRGFIASELASLLTVGSSKVAEDALLLSFPETPSEGNRRIMHGTDSRRKWQRTTPGTLCVLRTTLAMGYRTPGCAASSPFRGQQSWRMLVPGPTGGSRRVRFGKRTWLWRRNGRSLFFFAL